MNKNLWHLFPINAINKPLNIFKMNSQDLNWYIPRKMNSKSSTLINQIIPLILHTSENEYNSHLSFLIELSSKIMSTSQFI